MDIVDNRWTSRSWRDLIYPSEDWQVIKIRKVHKYLIQVDPLKFLQTVSLPSWYRQYLASSRRGFLLEERLVKRATFDSTLAAFQENIFFIFRPKKRSSRYRFVCMHNVLHLYIEIRSRGKKLQIFKVTRLERVQ